MQSGRLTDSLIEFAAVPSGMAACRDLSGGYLGWYTEWGRVGWPILGTVSLGLHQSKWLYSWQEQATELTWGRGAVLSGGPRGGHLSFLEPLCIQGSLQVLWSPEHRLYLEL